MSNLTDRTVIQNAWVVPDLEASIKKWVDFYGIGPFYIIDHIELSNVQHRGKPIDLDISVALAQAGPTQIELIQQHNTGPSAYRDMYAEGESGFHHLCIYSHDFDADLAAFEKAGYATTTVGQAPIGDLKFGYFDTRADFDVFMEVVTPTPDFLARGIEIAKAAENWDGADPIRR